MGLVQHEMKAFKYPEMRCYCDKLLKVAKSKKHTDVKFRNDNEMKLYRILAEHLEEHRTSNKRTSQMKLNAGVDEDAHAAVLELSLIHI